MADQQIIHTDNLILRPFVLSDAYMVKQLAGDPIIAKTTLNIPHPYENGMAESWIGTHREAFNNGSSVTYALVKNDTNELVGAIGLMINPSHRKAELGYWVGVPYWGNGYCTEASKALINYGFEELDLNKIYAKAFVSNIGSWTVMEKAGMVYEGTLRQEVIKDGVPHDLKSYAILRDEHFY